MRFANYGCQKISRLHRFVSGQLLDLDLFQIDIVIVAHRFSDPIGDAACRNGKPDFCKGLANLSRDMVSTILIASDRGQPGTSSARTFESAT
jgi:hypothetical protein